MSNSYREHILQKTSGTIRTFLQALATGDNYYRSLHNLTEQVTHQYSGRFLVELLQNSHDVLPESSPDGTSRIAIILEEHEEPFGALYVANDGQPFSPSNFNSLSALGQSDKDPEKSIGNKGIGFRSVLEITREPQIYSRYSEGSKTFDGYCFQFTPTVADVFFKPIHELLDGNLLVKSPISDKELLVDWTNNTLRDLISRRGINSDGWLRKELAYLSPYLLPLPLLREKMTERVAALEKEGFSTVIRLPFISAEARQLAISKLAELNINTTLFLERVSQLQLEAGTVKRTIRRVTKNLNDSQNGRDVTLEIRQNNVVTESKRYSLWNELIGGDSQPAVRDELLATVAHLPGSWKDMKSATVSLAVRIADEPEAGYFNIYLPTEVSTGCSAHISAPFFGDMSRTHINFDDRYNGLLLRKVAEKAVKIVIESLAGKGREEGRAIVDILAPAKSDSKTASAWYVLCSAAYSQLYKERGGAFHEQPFCLSENGWSPLDETSFIPETSEPRLLTEEVWYRHATFHIFASSLKSRNENIKYLFRTIGSDSIPSEPDLLDTFESVATWLHNEVEGPDWEAYWLDLMAIPMWKQNSKGWSLVTRTADSLNERRILLGNDKKLHKSVKEHTLFFPPQKGYDDDVENLDTLDIPPAFQPSMAFLDEFLSQHKIIRAFLSNGLVQDFRVEDIFKLIISPQIPLLPVPLKSKEGDLSRDILMWASKLVSGMIGRGKGKSSLADLMAKLPVPCNGGWFPAGETSFGPGWDKTCGEDLSVYLTGANTKECKELLKRLVINPGSNTRNNKGEQLRNVLVLAGVTNGFKCDLQKMNTLPGLEQYDTFDDQTRMAFMRLAFDILQSTESSGNPELTGNQYAKIAPLSMNSPLLSLLRNLRWIGCEKNSTIEWVTPGERWYVSRTHLAGHGWQFAHLNPLPTNVTSRIGASAVLEQNLVNLGMAKFDPENETDDPRLLNDLASALLAGDIADRNVFLGHIHDAWRLFRPTEQSEMPAQLIVTKGSPVLHVITPSDDSPVYLPNASATCTNALTQCELPVIEIVPVDAKEIAPALRSYFSDAVRFASDLLNWPTVNGKRWIPVKGERFSESEVGWLAPLMLTLFAFAGNKGSGFNTKTFAKAVQTVREAHVCWNDNLEIGLWQEEQLITSHPVTAFWLDDEKTLVCETNCISRYSTLSEALEALLGRGDLKRDLKLVLRELEQFTQPTKEQVCMALLNSLDIKPHQYYAVVEQWRGDISQLIHLLTPAISLLKHELDLDELGGVTTEEGLQSYIQQLQLDIEIDQLLASARASNDFQDLGKCLFEIFGDRFQLSEWNSALEKVGEKTITNINAHNEFRQHLSQSFVPLRALLLQVSEREGLPNSFAELSSSIDELELPEDLAALYWNLPFCESMRVVAEKFHSWNAIDSEIKALNGANSLESLKNNLLELLIDVSLNPFEIQKDNRESVRTAVQLMQRLAIAWGMTKNVTTTTWELPIDELFLNVWGPIERLSYKKHWTSADCYSNLKVLPQDDSFQEFWQQFASANDMASFVKVLNLTDRELSSAEESLETSKEKKRRQNRLVMVCGKNFDSSDDNVENLWGHISSAISPEIMTAIDLPEIKAFKELPVKKTIQSAFDREVPKTQPKERISKNLEKLIGISGEMWAYHVFLPKMFGDSAVNSSCWISDNSRSEYPDNIVDDGFGCDFKIHTQDKTYYIEVKASKGSDESFQMGVSEVRLADEVVSSRSRRKNEEFLILHIMNVLSMPQPRLLNNPYHPKYKDSYKIDNAGVRVRYRAE